MIFYDEIVFCGSTEQAPNIEMVPIPACLLFYRNAREHLHSIPYFIWHHLLALILFKLQHEPHPASIPSPEGNLRELLEELQIELTNFSADGSAPFRFRKQITV